MSEVEKQVLQVVETCTSEVVTSRASLEEEESSSKQLQGFEPHHVGS